LNALTALRTWLARGVVKASALTITLPWIKESFLNPTFRTLTKEAYQRNAAFFGCVSTLAFAFPEPPLMVWDDEGDDAKKLSTHPLRFLLRRPNPLMGEDEMAIWTMVYMAIGGNAYWHKVRGRGDQVVELWPYHAGQILPIPGGPTWISGYEFDDGTGNKRPIPTRDIVHFKWPSPDPSQPWMAQPPLMAAAREVDTDNEATRYLFALLKNDAIPRAMISLPADAVMTEEEKRAMRLDWVRKYGGENRGEIGILDGGAKFERMSMNLEELAFEALHRIPEARIASVMRVPPIVAGLNVGLERSTFANYGEAVKHFTLGTLVPLWRIVASEVEADLGSEFGGVYTRHDLSQVQALQEDETQKWGRANTAFTTGWLTLNEARRYAGYEDIKGGDVLMLPNKATPTPKDSLAALVDAQTERRLNPPEPPPTPALPAPGEGETPISPNGTPVVATNGAGGQGE
jgi:HK97 family phage portal protein